MSDHDTGVAGKEASIIFDGLEWTPAKWEDVQGRMRRGSTEKIEVFGIEVKQDDKR